MCWRLADCRQSNKDIDNHTQNNQQEDMEECSNHFIDYRMVYLYKIWMVGVVTPTPTNISLGFNTHVCTLCYMITMNT